MNEILELRQLSVQIQETLILSDINILFPKNQLTVIIGPSGAGKSTLLKAINKLVVSSGVILFNNKLPADIQEYRRKVIYVSQQPIVFQGNIKENLEWGVNYWKIPLDKTYRELLSMVKLENQNLEKDASSLSIGQQQRLHLARSLALSPEVLLLDEPSSALDAISKEAFEELITDLLVSQPNLSVIMVTHDINQAKRVANYAVLLVNGKISFQASSEQFFDQISNLSEAEELKSLIRRNTGV